MQHLSYNYFMIFFHSYNQIRAKAVDNGKDACHHQS